MERTVLAVKDAEHQRPIPSAWRPTLSAVVSALANGEHNIEGVLGVAPVSRDTAAQIQGYISDYGEVLTELSEATWESSVCIWMGSRWDVLIDLWTESEGRSDLVLSARVRESGEGYSIEVQSVHVP